MTNKTHWKKTVDKDWIGCYVLPEEKPINVKLLRVEYKEVKVKGIKDWYKVAYFDKNEWFDKPMLLSANVNLERVEKITGSPYIEDWGEINIVVTLQQEMDTAFGGGKDWALRIAPELPILVKPTIKVGSEKWKQAVQHMKDGKDIKLITEHYKLDIKKLEDAAKV